MGQSIGANSRRALRDVIHLIVDGSPKPQAGVPTMWVQPSPPEGLGEEDDIDFWVETA